LFPLQADHTPASMTASSQDAGRLQHRCVSGLGPTAETFTSRSPIHHPAQPHAESDHPAPFSVSLSRPRCVTSAPFLRQKRYSAKKIFWGAIVNIISGVATMAEICHSGRSISGYNLYKYSTRRYGRFKRLAGAMAGLVMLKVVGVRRG
jgi:hypothetical protein